MHIRHGLCAYSAFHEKREGTFDWSGRQWTYIWEPKESGKVEPKQYYNLPSIDMYVRPVYVEVGKPTQE